MDVARRWNGAGSGSAYWAVAVLGSGAAVCLMQFGHGRTVTAAVLVTAFLGLAYVDIRAAAMLLLGWLIVLGDVRRALLPLFGWSGQDPLLLVAPVVVALIVASLFVTRRIRVDTFLSKCVLLLMVLMLLQIMNPKQGGLAVGIGGALFYLIPLCWYWIARSFADLHDVRRVFLAVVLPLAALASCLGMYQVWIGFLPFEQAWIDTAGYAALWVGDRVRPFSFFVSAAEFSHFLSITIVAIFAFGIYGRRRRVLLLLPLLVTMLFLIGSRSPLVKVLFACAVLWAVMGSSPKVWAPRLLVAAAVGVAWLGWGLTQVQEMDVSGPAQNLVLHQTEGLLNPLDEEHSTAQIHTSMFVNGFTRGFSNPLGYGLGATTKAAGKFGGQGVSSEVDLSNLMLSLGVVGGLLYALIIGSVLLYAVRYWHRRREVPALAVIGILTVTGGSWLIGGEYSTTALVWFCIGALDRWYSAEATLRREGA